MAVLLIINVKFNNGNFSDICGRGIQVIKNLPAVNKAAGIGGVQLKLFYGNGDFQIFPVKRKAIFIHHIS